MVPGTEANVDTFPLEAFMVYLLGKWIDNLRHTYITIWGQIKFLQAAGVI